MVDLICKQCSKIVSVEYRRRNQIYCSAECVRQQRKINVSCQTCGKVFGIYPCYVESRKYCSKQCKNQGCGKCMELVLPPLTARQMEILNGCLLGDGYISKKPSHGGNACFAEKHVIFHEEYVSHLFNELGEWAKRINHLKPRKRCPNAQKELVSKKHKFWTGLRSIWYPKGKKIIPPDLILTPLTLAHWYCGDGTWSGKGCIFNTDGFTIEDVNILRDKMKITFDIKSTINNISKGPRIRISNSSWITFFGLIRPHIVNCFQYKLPTQEWLDNHVFQAEPNTFWIFKSPQGIIYETDNLTSLARNHNLDCSSLSKLYKGKNKSHKGWVNVSPIAFSREVC